MQKKTIVLGVALACGACAAGEEIDFASPHTIGGPHQTAGSGGDTNAGSAGDVIGASGSNGESGSHGQSGSNGQSGSGSGGAPQGDASPGGSGHGGAGGSSGAAGAGGSPVTMSDAGFVAGFSVLYMAEDSHATTSYVTVELHAKNGGSSAAQIGELKVRYYFTDEPKKTPKVTIQWSHVTTATSNGDMAVSSTVAAVVPPTAKADSYVEFGFSGGHPTLAPGESADFSWRMNGPNEGTDIYTQSNDYSFDASKTTVTTWDHVVLLRNGTVVWGTPPS